jgi:hypothetical protein
MSHVRFMAILVMLHVNNSENCIPRDEPLYDPLYKVHRVLSKLVKKFQDVYTPEEF